MYSILTQGTMWVIHGTNVWGPWGVWGPGMPCGSMQWRVWGQKRGGKVVIPSLCLGRILSPLTWRSTETLWDTSHCLSLPLTAAGALIWKPLLYWEHCLIQVAGKGFGGQAWEGHDGAWGQSNEKTKRASHPAFHTPPQPLLPPPPQPTFQSALRNTVLPVRTYLAPPHPTPYRNTTPQHPTNINLHFPMRHGMPSFGISAGRRHCCIAWDLPVGMLLPVGF